MKTEHYAEFDLIAPVYDATRRSPSVEELGGVMMALKGSKTVLEAGVGTGRYSVPLKKEGFEMTGIDISVEMMRLARSKGLERLILADLHRMPFEDSAFDSSLIIHVLQLIPDPALALRELARVSSDRVVAVLPEHGRLHGRSNRESFRRRYSEIAAELGYDIKPRVRFWENTEKVLELAPPDEMSFVEEPVDEREFRERWGTESRTFGGLITIPPEVHEKILKRLRKERGIESPPSRPHVRKMRIAVWNSAGLRSALEKGRAP